MKSFIGRYLDLSEEDLFEFRKKIRNFNKWYAYIIQITRMCEKELHKEYVFISYLQKLFPRPEGISFDLDDKLKLEYYKLKQSFKGDISLNPKVEETMGSYGDLLDTLGTIEDDDDYLDQIIERINEPYQGDFGDKDRVVLESIVK